MPPRLFVAGSANIDLTFRVPELPRRGVTELCRDYQQGYGGKGANQAVQAARLGASVTYLGKLGDDPFGPAYLRHFRDECVAVDYVAIGSGILTGAAVILVEPSGQNSIVASAGPNVTLGRADVQPAASAIAAADLVVSTLEVPGEAALELFAIARAAGVRTVLNTAPAVDFPRELLSLTDICVPNESELAAISGQMVDTDAQVESAAAAIRDAGPQAVIVTLGERGAMVLDQAGPTHIAGRRVNAVDTSGAGDAFTAALAVGLAEGKHLREAAVWANHVAALSVTRRGTQSSFATRDEVDRFIASA